MGRPPARLHCTVPEGVTMVVWEGGDGSLLLNDTHPLKTSGESRSRTA
jgi:hypothetical protein